MNKNLHLAATLNGNKEHLRKEALSKRNKLEEHIVIEASKKIATQLTELFEFNNTNVHLFYPIEGKKEINTWFIHELIKNTSLLHTSIYNKTNKDWDCVSFNYNEKFTTTIFDVPIPVKYQNCNWESLDIVLIPLLVFDKKGNRIGYGKGIYDTILSKVKPKCIKIGLSIFEPTNCVINTSAHDISLDYCLTPCKLHEFNKQ